MLKANLSNEGSEAVRDNDVMNTDLQEENINSHDGVDIDMNDIVVIDEYDSTKNDGKLEERKKVT